VVGRVRRSHGLRGELVVESLTDAPDAVFAPGRRVFAGTRAGALANDKQELHIKQSSPFKGGWIIQFAEVNSREESDTWRDRFFLLPDSEVEPPSDDEIFIHELVGMRVQHVNGSTIGEVAEVLELPQGLVIDVKRPGLKNAMLPYNEHTVTGIDAEARVIHVDPLEGLLD
jgi:16S rRNA processing protein RimM